MDSNAVEKTPKEIIDDLQRQLLVEKNRNRTLVEELKQLRDSHARIQIVTENEEEYITNKFMKYLNQLKKEKEELALKVEQEEEYLTNTLQKKMLTLMREKVDLENQLEQEEEFIVNKLQKQIQEVMKDKKILEKRLENEINDHRLLLKLEDEVIVLRDKIKELEGSGNGSNKKEDIDALKAENFVLGQKIIREQEKLTKVNSENTKLMSNLEIDDERNFNIKSKRNRSISFPNEKLATSITSSTSPSSSTSVTSSNNSITASTSSCTSNNNNNNNNNNIQTSPTCSGSNSSSNNNSNNNSLNNSLNNSGSGSCSVTIPSPTSNKLNTSGVPITRSRSSSSNSNPCLIIKTLREGWLKKKVLIVSTSSTTEETNRQIESSSSSTSSSTSSSSSSSSTSFKMEKRYYEISSDGVIREYYDESKQIPTSQYIDLDTLVKLEQHIDTDHHGYSDLCLHIQLNSCTPIEFLILSTYNDDSNEWKNLIESFMPISNRKQH